MNKILIIGSIPPPYHGVTKYHSDILKSPLNKEFTVKHVDTSDHRTSDNYNKLDLTNIVIGFKNIGHLVYYLITFKPDLVYCSPAPYIKPFIRESIFIILTKIIRNSKIVAHMHAGAYFKETFYENSNFLKKAFIRKILSLCDCGIVLGKNLMKDYEFFFKKIEFIWNGINVEEYSPIKSDIHKKEHITIGFLSNLCEAKGILTFIQALGELPDSAKKKIKIVVAGEWMHNEEKTKNRFYKLIDSNKLKQTIQIIGGIYSSSEKSKFYNETDIFIFPSKMEAFGLVNLEAMIHGCAVLSTYEGAIPEIVDDGKSGYLFQKEDSFELKDKILDLLDSPDKINSFGLNGKKRVLNNFTIEHNINKLIKVFNKTMRD